MNTKPPPSISSASVESPVDSVGTPPAPSDDTSSVGALTPKQEAFAVALVDTGSPSLAYRRAYNVAVNTKPGTIWSNAHQVSQLPQVRAKIKELREAAASKTVASKAQLVQFLWDRIMTDRRDLMNHHTYNCRHCYGERGQYQWKDELEWATVYAQGLDANSKLPEELRKPLPDPPEDTGGYGFDAHRSPNPGCEAETCMGHGIERTVYADTQSLTGGAALCYEGMEVTAQGIKMKIADRNTDIAQLAKLLGWSIDKVESSVTGAIGSSLPAEMFDIPTTSSPDEATRKYVALMTAG